MNEKNLSKYKRENWLAALKLKRNLLLLSSYKLLADVLCEWEEDYHTMLYAGRSNAAEAFLRDDNAHILGLTDPRNLFLKTMWSGKWPEKIAAALQYRLNGIYCLGYARPSFRTTIEPTAYADPVWVLLRRYFQANAYTLEYDEFLTFFLNNPDLLAQEAFHEAIALLVAVELDQQNPAIKKIVRDAVYENNGLMNHAIIMGLFYSKQPEYWQMAGDLLKAAKLQEGLRQAVLEACSDGRLEAFKFLITIIHEENLLRYASTVRAFDTWTLLGLEAARPETVRRAFSVATEFLGNPEKANAALNNDNPLQIYLALWAIANTEVHTAANIVEQMLDKKEGSLVAKCAALAFLRITGINFLPAEMLELLQKYRQEKVLCAYLFQNFVPEQLENPTDEIYHGFKALLDTMPEKPQKIQSPIFEWQELELSKNQIWITLVSIAAKANRAEIYDDLLSLMPGMPTEMRHYVVDNILEYIVPSRTENQHGMRVYHLCTNEDAAKRKTMQVTPQMREMVFQLFRDKSIPIREHAASIARRLKLSEPELLKVEDLLSLKSSNIRMEALEIIRANGTEKASAARLRVSGNAEKIAAAEELCPAVKVQIPRDREHGFGLYDPNASLSHLMPKADQKYHPQALIKRHGKSALALLVELNQLIDTHRNTVVTEYLPWGRRIEQSVDEFFRESCCCIEDEVFSCDCLPEELTGFFRKHAVPTEMLLVMLSILSAQSSNDEYLKEFYGTLPGGIPEFKHRRGLFVLTNAQLNRQPDLESEIAKVIPAIVTYSTTKFWSMQVSNHIFPAPCMPPIRWWWSLAEKVSFSPEFFGCLAMLHRNFVSVGEARFSPMQLKHLQVAVDAGLIEENEIARYLLDDNGRSWSFTLKDYLNHPPTVRVVQNILEIELTRGDLPTPVSKYLIKLPLLGGIDNWVRLLAALGKYSFVRGYIYDDVEKTHVFSSLIKVCRPLPGENADTLRQLVNEYKISDKRLLEAAMYAPAWLEIVGEYLNIPELPLAGWYFHAHVNENFSAEKETAVARYSSISPQEFNDGAFDIDWFHEAYNAVGPEMFAKLYDAAKYISGGANHRRSQIFADAALGKLSEAEVEEKIKTKRNKEFVMAYGILPGKANDFPRRYENLMKFKKESRQFGGQRQASEKLAVEIAVANLARTAGFSDVNRFLWRMEAAKLDELNALFAPHEADGVTLFLAIDSDGRAEIRVKRAEKELKSIPASFKKDAYVLELQSAVKSLRDQHSRAKKSLEEAMIREDVFEYAEVRELMANPVLGPLASKLLWQGGDTIDFFEKLPEMPLKIAHPTGLLRSGRWAEFQRLAVERKLVQPFKQIFRELYTLNADEKLDGMKSDRYSGNQVMPKKAVALLRTRGWTVDMEEGLQKVFHRQNLIAKIYALADWFSPAEVEPPTLEYVQFEHRRTREIIPLEKIAPVLFSEVMRDLDLMVSVAHAGGVDPEASHSTVEMRAALVSALLPLFKLDNVRIEKSHAFILGQFGEYTVHLGSGVCHKQTFGMLNILPVHSQTRGRLFLPFADDDPKTAEVLTKILFLAEDTKIKDPNILSQISLKSGGIV